MEFAELVALRRALRSAARRYGHGRWRVVDDLVDAAFDRVVDQLLKSGTVGPSPQIGRGGIAILLNLVRGGPPRVGLDLARVGSLGERVLAAGAAGERPEHGIVELPDEAFQSLSGPELRAVAAVHTAPTMRAAASAAQMSLRDLRSRLRRATSKLRKWCLVCNPAHG